MANCANHTETTATAFCRTCGRALCDECKRDVRGVIYCEECIAAHLSGSVPKFVSPPPAAPPRPPGTPNPTLAAFLGVLPGVGAFYNGQYQKGVIHVLMFPALIALVDAVDFFGILIPLYFGYMVVDAYKTARAKELGQPVPDYIGMNNLFTSSDVSVAPATTVTGTTAFQGRPPIGAFILIVLGMLFLLGNMGWIPTYAFWRYWPVVLIVLGIWKGYRRLQITD